MGCAAAALWRVLLASLIATGVGPGADEGDNEVIVDTKVFVVVTICHLESVQRTFDSSRDETSNVKILARVK